jgi:hypothetical protein
MFRALPQKQQPSPFSNRGGFCITLFEACAAFIHITACVLVKSPCGILYTEGFSRFVTSKAAPITTG